jgi:hypothetical protein
MYLWIFFTTAPFCHIIMHVLEHLVLSELFYGSKNKSSDLLLLSFHMQQNYFMFPLIINPKK